MQPYSFSVDYWSYGILLYEMLAGYSPFHGDDQDQLFKAIKGADLKFPSGFSEPSKTFIKCMLERDPVKRLGMKTSMHGNIRSHTFFSKIDWNKIENRMVEPPFKPKVKSPADISNFETEHTMAKAKLSQIDDKLLKTIDDDIFKGFSFVGRDLINQLAV